MANQLAVLGSEQHKLLKYKPLDVGKVRQYLTDKGIKNLWEGGGALSQIQEFQPQINTSLSDIKTLPMTGVGTMSQLGEASRIAGERIQQSQALEAILPKEAVAFARAGAPMEEFLKQQQVQQQPINFREGLTEGQQNSITNLMSRRPSSQWNETDIKNWNYATGGQAFPSGYPEKKPSGTITPSSMEGATGLNIPGGATDTSGVSDSFVTGANTSIAEIMKQLTPPETQVDKKQQTLLDDMSSLTGDLAKKASEQLTTEQSAGLPALRQQFADINAQILSKSAEYKVLQTANQNKPISMNTIIGNERAILNAQASDIGLLQARALGLQGQIEMAQATVDRAIDLKYSTIQAQLSVYQAQLDAIQPELNKQEKQQAMAQQLLLTDRQNALNDAKQIEKEIQSIMLKAAGFGADTQTLKSISSAKTLGEAITRAGNSIVDPTDILNRQLKQAQIRKSNYELSLLQKYDGLTSTQYAAKLKAEKKIIDDAKTDKEQRRLQGMALQEKITLLDSVLESKAIDSVVGPTFLTRRATSLFGKIARGPFSLQGSIDTLTGADDKLIGQTEQFISKEFLQSLIDVKAQGATFGALQKAEQDALTAAATFIGQRRITEGKGEDRRVVGYDMSEKDFKAELKTIQDTTRTAYERATGQIFTDDETDLLDTAFPENAFSPTNYFNN